MPEPRLRGGGRRRGRPRARARADARPRADGASGAGSTTRGFSAPAPAGSARHSGVTARARRPAARPRALRASRRDAQVEVVRGAADRDHAGRRAPLALRRSPARRFLSRPRALTLSGGRRGAGPRARARPRPRPRWATGRPRRRRPRRRSARPETRPRDEPCSSRSSRACSSVRPTTFGIDSRRSPSGATRRTVLFRRRASPPSGYCSTTTSIRSPGFAGRVTISAWSGMLTRAAPPPSRASRRPRAARPPRSACSRPSASARSRACRAPARVRSQ